MQDYRINVAQVEEFQMVGNRDALETFYQRAKTAIVNGAFVELQRGNSKDAEVFDRIGTLDELNSYFKGIFRYL